MVGRAVSKAFNAVYLNWNCICFQFSDKLIKCPSRYCKSYELDNIDVSFAAKRFPNLQCMLVISITDWFII